MMRHTFRRLTEFIPIFMPALSPSMETGTVVEWKKKVGDSVGENEVFCTVQTDKAVVDYTNSFDAGYLAKIYCQNGETADVSKTIALMVTNAEDIAKAADYCPEGADVAPAGDTPSPAAAPTATTTAAKKEQTATTTITAPQLYGGSLREAILASGPSVVRLAADLPEDILKSIVPSGKNGRYSKADFVGQPGFDYNDAVIAKETTATAATQVHAPLADIYDIVLEAGPILRSVDDTKLLRQLLSTMSLPNSKKASA